MNDTGAENGLREEAALYALGALSQHEARSFEEHVAEGCTVCAAKLEAFERVVTALGLSAPEADPPAAVRARLLARACGADGAKRRAEPKPKAEGHTAARPHGLDALDFHIVRSGEGRWRETPDRGVFVKVLFVDRERDTITTLVRMEPGARIPRHRHRGVEQCLVLEGDVRSGAHTMGAGDFNCSLRGSIHDELTSEGGALLFIIAPESYEVLKQGNQF